MVGKVDYSNKSHIILATTSYCDEPAFPLLPVDDTQLINDYTKRLL